MVIGQINREVIHSSLDASSPVLKDIRYYYDVSGKPIAIRAFTRTSSTANFTDTIYYLQTNLQGDVVGIYNASGTKIYEYAYDAWGNIIKSAQVAAGGSAAHAVNPFRYRGYYYDIETSLYYLQSRYYNPEWGRFLNADVYVNANGDLLGYNMYAYCSNNPVMYSDLTGEKAFWEGFENYDGTYSLHDNMRHVSVKKRIQKRGFIYHEQLFSFSPALDGAEVSTGPTNPVSDSILSVGGSFSIYTGRWETKHSDFSLMDFGVFGAKGAVTTSGVQFEFSASAWSPTYTYSTKYFDFTIGVNVGVKCGFTKTGKETETHLGVLSLGLRFK